MTAKVTAEPSLPLGYQGMEILVLPLLLRLLLLLATVLQQLPVRRKEGLKGTVRRTGWWMEERGQGAPQRAALVREKLQLRRGEEGGMARMERSLLVQGV